MFQRLVLTASLGDAPARWSLVAKIGFGPAGAQVGLVNDQRRAPIPIFPPSFAIGPDGTIWILDSLKSRLAHYAANGHYLGSVPGFPISRTIPQPLDMAFAGGVLYVLKQFSANGNESVVATVNPDESHEDATIVENGKPVWVSDLVAGPAPLEGYGQGSSGSQGQTLGSGRHGYAELGIPGSAGVTFIPGVRIGSGRWLDIATSTTPVDEAGDQDFIVTMSGPDAIAERPIHVKVTTGPAGSGRSLPAEVQTELDNALPDHAPIYVKLAPSASKDAERYGGGEWFLELSDDGSALIWERLPDPGLSSEIQVRHLATGPDGSVYLMLAQPYGLEIYRRPPAP